MKKIILVVIAFLFVQLSYSQDDDIKKMIKSLQLNLKSGVIKGIENTYTTDTLSFLCTVVNQRTSNKKPGLDNSDPSFKISLISTDMLNSILKKNLSTCVDFEKLDGGTSFFMIFEGDLFGKIDFVSLIYPCRLNIPITVIEQIETDIRNQCRLDFNKNSTSLNHANYVTYSETVFLKEACF